MVVPLLTRELIDMLATFVANCSLGPKIQLAVEKYSLSNDELRTVAFPFCGVWSYKGSYKGPLALVPPSAAEEGTLTHTLITEPAEWFSSGIRRLPKCVQELEIQLREWDAEVLFAIRALFPDLRRLVVTYGRGRFPADFLITLGSNVLFDLKNLHTIKILQDRACAASRERHPGGFPTTFRDGVDCEAREPLDHIADLEDYLLGWTRFCRALRVVQLGKASWWERRFEGHRWDEVEVKQPQKETASDRDRRSWLIS